MITFRSSEIGGCSRALVYEALGFPREPYDKRSRLTLELGKLMEPVILREQGYEDLLHVQKEMVLPVTRGVQIVGHPDGVWINSRRYLLEVKTMRDFAWRQARDGGIKDKYPGYFAQGSTYFVGWGCDVLRFICFNKDSSDTKEIDYEGREVAAMAARMVRKARRVACYVEAGEIPGKPGDLAKWQCQKRYCQFWCCEYNEGHKFFQERKVKDGF